MPLKIKTLADCKSLKEKQSLSHLKVTAPFTQGSLESSFALKMATFSCRLLLKSLPCAKGGGTACRDGGIVLGANGEKTKNSLSKMPCEY